jgi:hypothetical protein
MPHIINTPQIVHEFMDEEVIAIDFDTGSYFSLTDLASYVWRAIDRGQQLEAINDSLVESLDLNSSQQQEIADFYQQLIDNNLLRDDATPPQIDTSAAIPKPQTYNRPTLQKYTDMEKLLLLDPIHEVDEVAGWPMKK